MCFFLGRPPGFGEVPGLNRVAFPASAIFGLGIADYKLILRFPLSRSSLSFLVLFMLIPAAIRRVCPRE
jgi:hypothetical protein